ncbi:hypothetical protein EDD16DRAFT_1261261 [Pisolithus croceorrhizus]|nr:hypothetical protein EV401DRAFT_765007 [Pisolithus croceorrhizus]KAI6109442.1 hypothetical protein EDD16DRAFT_1261261 [Pisolithus croceorrhizus]KAI6152870.1 hypothetical protein EDD17DRAFT_1122374 [Pisolithus thermaeus]
MDPPPGQVWFYFPVRETWRCLSVSLADGQAFLDDIIPSTAACLSTRLGAPIGPTGFTVWKLNEPGQLDESVSATLPLESIATEIPDYQPISPYICRGDEPVSLLVQLVPTVPQGKKRALEEVDDDLVETVKRAKVAIQSPSSLAQPRTLPCIKCRKNSSSTTVVSVTSNTVPIASILWWMISPLSHFSTKDLDIFLTFSVGVRMFQEWRTCHLPDYDRLSTNSQNCCPLSTGTKMKEEKRAWTLWTTYSLSGLTTSLLHQWWLVSVRTPTQVATSSDHTGQHIASPSSKTSRAVAQLFRMSR